MFDQSLLPEQRRSRKPLSILASVALQSAAVAVLILLSVVFTQRLPVRQLKSMLLPPPPFLATHNVSSGTRRISSVTQTRSLIVNLAAFTFNRKFTSQAAPLSAPDISVLGTGDTPQTGVVSDIFGNGEPALHPPTAPRAQPPHATAPMYITSTVAAANLIYKVVPPYPRLAQISGVQGAVEFTALIGKDGRITNLHLLRGHPLLVAAATQAVLQWRYRPTLLNGMPVDVATAITVNFKLAQ
jgi:protein TonB